MADRGLGASYFVTIAVNENPMTSNPDAIELSASELPASCPNPKMTLWNQHPRVFLDVATTGQASCPYCGTKYKLKDGETIDAH